MPWCGVHLYVWIMVKGVHCRLLWIMMCHECVFRHVPWRMHGHEAVLLKPIHVKLGHSLPFCS